MTNDVQTALPTVELFGLDVHQITERTCVERVLWLLEQGEGGWVVTPNLDILRLTAQEPELNALVSRADLRVADGMPLIWASRILGTPFPERVSGSNLIFSLTEGAAHRNRSVFLLGGMPGVGERAAGVLKERFPGLKVAGVHCPPFGFEADPTHMAALEKAVGESGADIVYVALGFPKGEKLTQRIRHLLPKAWWVGVGISLSFVTGDVARAPAWMQRGGLEWFHRLSQEPQRLASRYLVHDLPFAGQLFFHALRRRWVR